MTLTKSATRNGAGTLENIKNTINLTGKILRNGAEQDFHISGIAPGQGTGTGPIFSGINELEKLFKNNDFGEFKVTCGNSPTENVLFIASGVRFNSMNFEKTPDNWTQTADYTIDLEFYEPAVTGYPLVQQTSDNWSIEPLEEYCYTSFRYNINQRSESYNPNLKPTSPTINDNNISYIPSVNTNGANTDTSYLNIVNIPQFKISRKVSAIGLANPSSGQINGAGNRSYKEAQKWVESRLATPFTSEKNNSINNIANSGMPNFSSSSTSSFANFTKTFLFNHLRTTNFSVTDGSYEVNESWLAMPTGIMYIEDYNIDTSTDDRYVRTVRVQGSIKGLHMIPLSIMSGSLQPDVSGTGFIDLTYSTGLNPIQINQKHSLLDTLNPPTASTTALASSFQPIESKTTTNSPNKYENANSGWIYDIKPYLYRRACLVVNSLDRDYIDPKKFITNPNIINQSGIGNTPKNPTYVKENLLNIIPVSTTEGHDPRKGTISYTYEFTNKFNTISGVLSENITTSQTNPIDIVAEAFVLGRRLGPVLQNMSARTSSKKDITIEVNVVPPMSIGGLLMTNTECPLYTGGVVYNNISTIIEGLKPYGDRPVAMFGNFDKRTDQNGTVYLNNDTETWNPTEGKYIRSASWIFQPCTNSRRTLDN
jgi:hypothetical protein